MEKKAIIELLKKPQYLKLYNIEELRSLVLQYPYFKQLKMLLLKKIQMVEPEQAAQILPQIATDISNRQTLYRLLQKPIHNLPVQIEATKNKIMPVSQEVINTIKRSKKVRLSKKNPVLATDILPAEEVQKELIQLKLLAEKKAKKQKTRTPVRIASKNIKEAVSQDLEKLRMNTNTNFQTQPKDNLLENIRKKINNFNESRNLTTQSPKSAGEYSEEDIKQMMLTDKSNMNEIYQFIEGGKDKRLQKDNMLSAEEAAKKSSKQNMESVTETIALLYVKQGAVNKAIKVYKKLCLKYPKKSVYFAKKIQELKNNI